MENLKNTLSEIYKISPYLSFNNKTKFDKSYSDIYGEVTEKSTNGIVNYFKDYFNENTVFYDLGCGLGKMVAHIGLQYNPKKSCGIELSKERIDATMLIKEKYCKDNDNISFIEGDFFLIDFSDATVVYCDDTAMSQDVTKKIIDNLPKGCLFIFRKSLLPNDIKFETVTGLQFNTTYDKYDSIHYIIK